MKLSQDEIVEILGLTGKKPCPVCSSPNWNIYHNEGCPKDEFICCNADCGWTGKREQCVTFKHDSVYLMCPNCNEAVERKGSEEE